MIGLFVLAAASAIAGGTSPAASDHARAAEQEMAEQPSMVAAAFDAAETAVTEAPPPLPATRKDIEIACRLAADFHAIFRATQSTSARETERRLELTRTMTWRYLPIRARCGRRAVVFRPGKSSEFVTDVAQSAQGRVVGVRGGWRMGEPAGAGGDCFYERVGAKLIPRGCVRLWAS